MKLHCVLLWVLLFGLTPGVYAQKIKVITEHLPPMQITDNGKLVGGVGVEVVKMLLLRAGSNSRIVAMNWARAIQMAQNMPNVMIFSITRNADREDRFKWVGTIATFDNYLWRHKSREDIVVETLSDAMRYRTAVPRNDMQHNLLKSLGFNDDINLVVTSEYKTAIKLLLRDRVELIAGNRLFLTEQLKGIGQDISQMMPTFHLAPSTLYIAFSRQTDDAVVEHYRSALKIVKNSERYKLLMLQWQLD